MKGKSIMHRDYTTNNLKKRIPMILAIMLLAVMVALNVCVKEPELEPDGVFPMANAKVGWLQSYHNGGWTE
jgi:hypothetical protein